LHQGSGTEYKLHFASKDLHDLFYISITNSHWSTGRYAANINRYCLWSGTNNGKGIYVREAGFDLGLLKGSNTGFHQLVVAYSVGRYKRPQE